jgi:hypothetical protein
VSLTGLKLVNLTRAGIVEGVTDEVAIEIVRKKKWKENIDVSH